MSEKEKAKPSPEKTLGDFIQEALKRATAEREKDATEPCDCMACSGNPVRARIFAGNTMHIQMREGTKRDGTPEMEIQMTMGMQDEEEGTETQRLLLGRENEVAEFKQAMKELFA